MSNNIYCLIAASGAGKSSIAKELPFPKVVSYRTREPRVGEVDGVDGHFISLAEWDEMNEYLIATTLYRGNYYGITQGELLELEDSPLIYVVDWNGFVELKESIKKLKGYEDVQVFSIYLQVRPIDLETRMIKQGRSMAEIDFRLDRIQVEQAIQPDCDYTVLNENEKMEKTLWDISKIIMNTTWNLTNIK